MKHPANAAIVINIWIALATLCCTALAQRVAPGALLYLDFREQVERDETWKNLGESGGEIPVANELPELEEGNIEILALGINEQGKWYTSTANMQTFSGPAGTVPALPLEDWTLEILARRNGDGWVEEHHLVGFQTDPREKVQWIRIRLTDGAGGLGILMKGAKGGAVQYEQARTGIQLGLDEWHWLTFVHTNQQNLAVYLDGNLVGNIAPPGTNFNADTPIDSISIGANHFEERRRSFNGSLAIIRVYDRALSEPEVGQNITNTILLDVRPAGKLAATWGNLKRQRSPR